MENNTGALNAAEVKGESMMNKGRLEEIKKHVANGTITTAEIYKLIIEVQRIQNRLGSDDTDETILALDTILKLRNENTMLKKALELMYEDNKAYNPDGMGNPVWYIQQAQKQDGQK